MTPASSSVELSPGLRAPTVLEATETAISWGPIEHQHGAIEVVGAKDPIPYTLALPSASQSELITLIVPGYGAFKRTSRGLRDSLAAQEGIATVSYDPARIHGRRRGSLRDLFDPQALHLNTLEAIVDDLKVPDGRLVLLAHSMGSLAASDFAARYPDKLAGVVYLGPVGMGSPGPVSMARRGVQELGTDVLPAIAAGRFGYSPAVGKRAIRYFANNPLRTVGEAISCGQPKIVQRRIEYAARLGVRQAVVAFEHDRFFPPDEISQAVSHLVDSVTELKESQHLAPQREPQRVARLAGQLIRSFAT